MVYNPGFEDLDSNGSYGDGWGGYGAQGFDNWFPNGNPGHVAFYADNTANWGGFYQLGIPGTPGVEYTFSIDASFESQYDARTLFGLEFYEADDATKIGDSLVDLSEVLGVGYYRISMSAVAPAGTVIVRPIIMFDQVASAGSQRAATFDNADLVPAPMGASVLGAVGLLGLRRRRR
jgi:hypothetical protein